MSPPVAPTPEPQGTRNLADASIVSGTTESTKSEPTPDKPAASVRVVDTEVPVNFVDLYEVLQVPPETQAPVIRKRIMELYLEAQKNLDHRNTKKRLFFNQLFEVHLPQARYLLLDPKRRATYDGHLNVFREDHEKEAVIQNALENSDSVTAKDIQEQGFEPPVIEENLSPEELAERRAKLWELWQQSLEQANDPLAKLTFSMPEIQARKVERDEFMQRALVEVRQEDRRHAEEQERQRQEAEAARLAEEQRARDEAMGRRRETRFREAVDNLTATARLYWAFGVAGGILLLSFALLFVLDVYFATRNRFPFGSADTFHLVCFLFTSIACSLGAWRGAVHGATRMKRRAQRRRNAQQEATNLAAQIIAQNHPKATPVELAELQREEAAHQLRVMRRSDTVDMLVHNSSVGWAFGLSEGVFAIGFALIFLLDMFLSRGTSSPSRPLYALLGLIVTLILSVAAGYFGFQRGRKQQLSHFDGAAEL